MGENKTLVVKRDLGSCRYILLCDLRGHVTHEGNECDRHKMADVRLFALIVALVLSYFNQTAASKRANDNFKTPLLGFTVLEDSFRKEFLTKCSSKVQQRIPVTDEMRKHAS